MIGKLKGIIDSFEEDHLILDVNGVGYVVYASQRTLDRLASTGEAVVLHVETQVREDAIRLFGFSNLDERNWFRLLQNVQGVGAKVALAILAILSPDEIMNAITLQDRLMIGRASGVGPKLAARIVAELKDKAPMIGSGDPLIRSFADSETTSGPSRSLLEATSALINLGYNRAQAAGAVATAYKAFGADSTTSDLIRRALKELSSP